LLSADTLQQPEDDELEGLGASPSFEQAAGAAGAKPSPPGLPPGTEASPAATASAAPVQDTAPAPTVDTDATQARPRPAERLRVSPPDAPVSLDYRIFYEDYRSANRVAVLKLHFELDGSRYRLTTEARASGLMAWIWRGTMIQTSEGSIDSGGLVPQHYSERRAERAPRIAVIDPQTARVRFGDDRETAAPAGTQDRLSVLLQIGLFLAAMPTREAGTVLDLPLLATSRLDASRWRVEGEEMLEMGESAVATTRVRKLGSPGSAEGALEIWFPIGSDPWPLRLRFSEPNGRTLDQIREPIR
jgi:hypothetical protein